MASSPNRPSTPDILTGRPKDHTRGPPTPPPAYFPRPGPPLFMNPYFPARLAAAAAAQPASGPPVAAAAPLHPLPMAAAAAVPHLLPLAHGWQNLDSVLRSGDSDGDSDGDGDGDRSAITVRISTAVRVTGDNNIMCLAAAADPAETARFVAQAVTRVLRGGGAEERGGIPMIDEEGRPRPLRIEIEAGTEVRGEGNVVGGEAVVMQALGKRRREGGDDGEEDDEEEDNEDEGQAARRRRRRRGRRVSV